MRKLIISGDSFTLGSELENKSWAELLGDKLGYENVNVSVAGAGNATIARRTLEALPLEHSAVAVMWTFIARFDHFVDGVWRTTTPHTTSTFDTTFYKHVGNSELYELHNTLANVLLLQNTLERYKIPYVFTSADHEWATMHFTNDPWISKLMLLIDWDKWYTIDCGNGFYKWGTRNYPCGEYGHPLDAAHIDLCSNILPFATNLIGFSN